MITGLLLGAIALGLLGARKQAVGVGRLKRRIYVEIEAAQKRGVDFGRKFTDLPSDNVPALAELGEQFGWKQSKRSVESGKTYAEAYYNSLKRAYNAISGVSGIGVPYATHTIKNSDGRTILTWTDYDAMNEHVQAETKAREELDALERKLAKRRSRSKRSYTNTPVLPDNSAQQLDLPFEVGSVGVGDQFHYGLDKMYVIIIMKDGCFPETRLCHTKIDADYEVRKEAERLKAMGFTKVTKYKNAIFFDRENVEYSERWMIIIDHTTAY